MRALHRLRRLARRRRLDVGPRCQHGSARDLADPIVIKMAVGGGDGDESVWNVQKSRSKMDVG
jgi:hypothetical protein